MKTLLLLLCGTHVKSLKNLRPTSWHGQYQQYILCGRHRQLCSSRLKSTSTASGHWKPFLLTDELTTDVKKSIEVKWGRQVYGASCQAEVDRNSKNVQNGGQKKYVLSMFPYPSGKLHLGHVRVYTLSDVLARYFRFRGHEVIHPMGWDAFGLPAENAARDHGVEAEKWTRDNIQFMKSQIINMGCSFDWSREFATCDPSYYKWTQWLFYKLWEHGLAYKKQSQVFWDPVDQTVLAEEQVDEEQRSWRSGAKVEKKLLNQWFIRTSVYAKELTDSLASDDLKEGWRDIIALQRHWIGSISGHFSDRELVQLNGAPLAGNHFLRLWFSSPAVVPRAKFVLLSPTHYLVKDRQSQNVLTSFDVQEVQVKQMNFFMKNPVSNLLMPIFCCETETSTESSEIMPKIPESSDCRLDEVLPEGQFAELSANEGFLEELNRVYEKCEKPDLDPASSISIDKPQLAQFVFHHASLKLRDWLISRQRKWGTPIPALNCLHCGKSFAAPAEQLPVLPETVNSGLHTMPLCSKCGTANVLKETDTLDTFFDSSWYFLRYLDPTNPKAIFDPEVIKSSLPVDIYIGGKEHATLHLYYARFMAHFLHRLGLIPVKEVFRRLIPVGIVTGETYIVGKTGKYLSADKVEARENNKFVELGSNLPVSKKWEKMSKSKYNGIDPDSVISQFGLDATRLLSMADVIPTSPRKWNEQNLAGFLKFQQKLWSSVQDLVSEKEGAGEGGGGEGDHRHSHSHVVVQDDEAWKVMEDEIFDARNYYLKGITHNYSVSSHISVVISKLQGLVGSLRKYKKSSLKDSIQFERAMGTILITLYPIMPAFSAQLWQYFREVATHTGSEFDLDQEIWFQQWPDVDMNYCLDMTIELSQNVAEPGKKRHGPTKTEYLVKVPRHVLDTMDNQIALELALEEPALEGLNLCREELEILALDVKPGYAATFRLKKNPSTSTDKELDQKLQQQQQVQKNS